MHQYISMHVLVVAWLLLSNFTALGSSRSIPFRRSGYNIRVDKVLLNTTEASELDGPAASNILLPRRASTGSLLPRGLTNPFKPKLSDPDLYKASKARGKVLSGYLDDPFAAPKSPWAKFEDLKEWGWTHKKIEEGYSVAQFTEILKEELASLHLSAAAPPNVDFTWRHSEPVAKTEGGASVVHPATHAQYNNILNPTQGAIIAYHNYGPAFEAEHGLQKLPAGAPLPQLKSWSDVTYLTWASLTSSAPQTRAPLKYVLHKDLTSPKAKTLIADVLRKSGIKTVVAPPWPGITIKRSSSSAFKTKPNGAWLALLESPNVRGVAWLLAQHWEDMGRRTVGGITV